MKKPVFLAVALAWLQLSVAHAQPNIILIVTDDQRADEWQYMPGLQAEIATKGMSLPNFYVSTSLCCPSRSSILRGQYAHNTNVKTNDYPSGGWQKFHAEGLEESNIVTWLRGLGYQTALFGKYLNGYPNAPTGYIPPGWSRFFVTSGRMYYGYNVNNDGVAVHYGTTEADYQPSVVGTAAVNWVETQAASRTPFFAYISPNSPHSYDNGPPPYLSRYANDFAAEGVPRTPSFNEADVLDKPSYVRKKPLLTDEQMALMDEYRRARLRSLQPVDEMITSIIAALDRQGQLQNTYIVATNDNGYLLGEHRILPSKNLAYEEATRVAAFIRGPGIAQGVASSDLLANIDLAPTFVQMAGIAPPDYVTDGRSILSMLRGGPSVSRRALLLDNYTVSKITNEAKVFLSGFVTREYKYIEYGTGTRELYDLVNDPYEVQNLASSINTDAYSTYLAQLAVCAASSCRVLENNPPAWP